LLLVVKILNLDSQNLTSLKCCMSSVVRNTCRYVLALTVEVTLTVVPSQNNLVQVEFICSSKKNGDLRFSQRYWWIFKSFGMLGCLHR
jgi:hypothetical protein